MSTRRSLTATRPSSVKLPLRFVNFGLGIGATELGIRVACFGRVTVSFFRACASETYNAYPYGKKAESSFVCRVRQERVKSTQKRVVCAFQADCGGIPVAGIDNDAVRKHEQLFADRPQYLRMGAAPEVGSADAALKRVSPAMSRPAS